MSALAKFRLMGAPHTIAAEARDALLFIACFVALHWLGRAGSYASLGTLNLTPWDPALALAIVWMLYGGLRYAVLVFVANLTAGVLIPIVPASYPFVIGNALLQTAGLCGIAAVLKFTFQFDGRLRTLSQLWILIAVAAAGTALIGVLKLAMVYAAGVHAEDTLVAAMLRVWLGDALGILVTAPLLMVAADREARRRLVESWHKRETKLEFIALVALVYFVFGNHADPYRYFYLVFLLMIWISLRNGVSGAALGVGVVQVGVVVTVQVSALDATAMLGLQSRVAALTVMALALGVMVAEREQAAETFRRSLRLVAAGEMAGAIAHEIKQPLTALHTYASACQAILRDSTTAHPDLSSMIEKMLHESRRISDIVSRVRELFRAEAMQIEPVSVGELLESVRRIGAALNTSGNVAFRLESIDQRVMLLVDRVQIELLLRNLIANAFEAVAGLPPGSKAVTVSTRMLKGKLIRIRVADSGPGLSPGAREHLFEPFSTTKASGMGIGLAICRMIADAHHGSLRATGRDHGEFDLVLPAGVPID